MLNVIINKTKKFDRPQIRRTKLLAEKLVTLMKDRNKNEKTAMIRGDYGKKYLKN